MKLYEFLLNNAPYHTGIYATTRTIADEDPYYLLHGKYVWLNEGKWLTRHHNIDDLRDELEDSNVEDFVINDWLNREIVEFDSFFNYLDAAKFFIEKIYYPSVEMGLLVIVEGIDDEQIPNHWPIIANGWDYDYLTAGTLKLPDGYYVENYHIKFKEEETK